MSNYDSPVNELPKATKRQKVEFYFRKKSRKIRGTLFTIKLRRAKLLPF